MSSKSDISRGPTPLSDQVGGDTKLPPRLFATNKYPQNRLNIYSRPDILAFLRHVLRDTHEFELIRGSSFGKLFDLPARQCPVSCKLIHALLSRQLVCNNKYTLWSTFGGQPLRYGLQEFGTITALPCGPFLDGYVPAEDDAAEPHQIAYWEKLIGKRKTTTIADIGKRLEKEPNMPSWKKVGLAKSPLFGAAKCESEEPTAQLDLF